MATGADEEGAVADRRRGGKRFPLRAERVDGERFELVGRLEDMDFTVAGDVIDLAVSGDRRENLPGPSPE